MTPTARKSIELETTSTAYSGGVGFFEGRENINSVTPPNENKISHGRVSWQRHWRHFAMGPLASSIG
jgi:hypothetical protein